MLRQIGITPDRIVAPDIDETPLAGESPRAYALRMALAKLMPGEGYAIAADTVVAAGARILPKAESLATGPQMSGTALRAAA